MKFAQQLRQGAVEEWRRAYIDYRLLKKLIKAAAKLEDPSLDGQVAEDSEAGQPLNLPPSSASNTPLSVSRASSETITASHPTPPVNANPKKIARIQSGNSDHDENVLRKRKFSRPGSVREARWRYPPDIPLKELVPQMTPSERKFFEVLDQELEKVEAFYEEREAEAVNRYKILTEQLEQLAQHRAQYVARQSRFALLKERIPLPNPSNLKRVVTKQAGQEVESMTVNGNDSPLAGDDLTQNRDGYRRAAGTALSPENYIAARRKLKVAMWEFYRFLGYVKSYRLLNRTGFSKVTKKMEKVTKIKCQNEYNAIVSKTHFANSKVIDDLQSDTETLFGVNFEKGSRKKAVQRLRFMGATTSHHFASWRAGAMLGAALPAIVDGIVKACHADTRARIPGTETLLQLYGALLLPVLLAWGVGINLVGWTRARINIPLVFYFDTRTHIDYRVYLEIPTLLLFTLSWCFWLSFTVQSETVSPQVWPLVWIISTILILFNPFPIFHANARWWIIRSTIRVFSAGIFRVQFRDFWLGDQFCSLYYTSYNLGLIVCAYKEYFASDVNSVCSTNRSWASPVLASLPYLWRLGQSFRRYADARDVYTHLVNAGKYTASILYLFLYFTYRIEGSNRDATFVAFIVFACINSCYSFTWDVLMDWNLCKRNSKYPLLRNDLAFGNHIWFYYFALVTNLIGRFTWFIYLIPGQSVRLTGFIIALLETARRFQWNFLRVESEHLGNVDGFRVTRDVPLPYTIPHGSTSATASIAEDEADEDLDERSRGEQFKVGEGVGVDHELGARVSKFPGLLPGEFAKRLKTAVFGRKADNPDESDDEDDSPATDTARDLYQRREGGQEGEEGLEERLNIARGHSSIRPRTQNYNTFGWESDPERPQPITEAE